MPIRQACPGCGTALMLPDSGVGRCPRCQAVVRTGIQPAAAHVPEVGPEHEHGTDEPAPPRPAQPPPLPHPEDVEERPRRRRQRRNFNPEDHLELPNPSRTGPVIVFSILFALSLILTIGSMIYLFVQASR